MRTLILLLLCVCVYLTSPATIQEKEPAAIRVPVEEGRDAILPCSLDTGENIEQALFDWKKDGQEVFLHNAGLHYNNGHHGQDEQFKGRVFHFQDELERGNASIIIRNTKISDSGKYLCHFPLLQPNERKFYVELVVDAIYRDRSGEIKEAIPKPYTRNLGVTEDGVLLQCEVLGASPKPEVEWQDSAGNNLTAEEPQVRERGGSYDIILFTTVTKSGNFSCVIKQKGIGHEISAETYVSVPEKRCEDWIGWFFGGWSSGVLTLAAVLALLVFTKCIKVSRNKGSPPQRNGSCNGSSHVPLKPVTHQNGNGESNGFV